MRREYFTLRTRTPDGPDDAERPNLVVSYDGPVEELTASLTDDAGEPLPAAVVDVACRLQSTTDGDCVVALTHRLTGEFLLEVNGDAATVLDLVDAARSAADGDASYRVRVETPSGSEDVVYDKETLLVYDEEGSLLRQHSLIPSGVEL